jgi:aminopeptidase N
MIASLWAVTSLTHVSAERRARAIRVDSYEIALDFTIDDQHFASVTTIRFAASPPDQPTFVDLAPHELRTITLNGRPLDVAAVFDAAASRISLLGLAEHNELVVDAVMAYSHDGEGMHRHVDPADGRTYLYAMSFLAAAPRWYACFDQPDLKAPVGIDVRCPAEWRVAGNGPAVEVAAGHWQLRSTGPLATYFTTLVAGPYHEVRSTHDGVPLVLHARQSLAEHLDRDADELLAHTRHCLDELHHLFGVRYPWGEYHQAFVPEFNAGAMENPGCVTLRDDLIFRSRVTDADRANRAVTIAHEMAHMWFGDLVTMRWWDDLWLNESFAEYLGHRITGEHTWTAFGIERKSWGYAADRRPSTHPVAGNGAPDAAAALADFDGISYAKGASVLRQLAAHLGDAIFLDGLRRYIQAHANGNAEFADLIAAWTAAGAVGLDEWTQVWLRTSGMDTITVDDGAVIRTVTAGPARPHAIVVAAFDETGRELGRQPVTVNAGRTLIEPAPSAALVLPDATDETWAKIALPSTAWEAMPARLAAIDDARARVVVWNALQLAVADADVDPQLALEVTLAALTVEPDNVLAVVGRWVLGPLAAALPAAAVGPGLARLATVMLDVCTTAAPGSGRQLAAARLAIAATADSGLLRSWLSGSGTPDGLVVDTDLRWAVLVALASAGDLDADEIDAEAAADRSTAGAVRAAQCRAARPDAEAKAAAWQALTSDADRPNYELYAMADGFWQLGQRELTAPYVERYFTEIPATARLRSGWVVARVALRAFPWTAVSAGTLAAVDRLVDGDVDAGIRRSVIDAGDDLRRALAARTRFGA